MPSPRQPAVLFSGLTLIVGFLLGWFGHPHGTPVSSPPQKATSSQAATRENPKSQPLEGSQAEAALDKAVADPVLYRQRLLLGEAVARMDRETVASSLEQELKRHSLGRLPVLMALLSRFAELDPAAATARAAALFDPARPAESHYLVTAALGAWLANDRPGAERWWTGLPAGPLRDLVTNALLEQLTDTDPQEALRLALQTGSGDPHAVPIERIFARLAERDPRAASQAAQKLPNQEASRVASEQVAATWASHNPAEAYAWFKAAPDLASITRIRTLMSVYDSWSKADPAAAGAFLLAQGLDPNAPEDARQIPRVGAEMIGGNWAQKDPQAALAWAGQLPANIRDGALKGIMETWSKNDPRGVAMYVASMKDSDASNRYLEPALTTWAKTDPAAVRDWVQTLPAGATRDSSAGRLAREWSNRDPQAAMDFMVSEKNSLLTYLLGKWMGNDPDRAIRWGQNLPPSDQRDSAMATIIFSLGGQDPAKAQSLYAQLPASAQTVAAQNLVDAMARQHPEDAARWLAAQPAGTPRDLALPKLAESWGFQNVQNACDWLATQPADAVRDGAVSQMIKYVGDGRHDMAPAIPLAQSIQDPGTRTNALETIARAWLKKDATAATAWVNESPDFSAKQRAKLIAPGG